MHAAIVSVLVLALRTRVCSIAPAATIWQPTVAQAAPAMPMLRGPSTNRASPATLTAEARRVARVGEVESLAPRQEACKRQEACYGCMLCEAKQEACKVASTSVSRRVSSKL